MEETFNEEEKKRIISWAKHAEQEIGIEISMLPVFSAKEDVYKHGLLMIIKVMQNYYLMRPKFVQGYLLALIGFIKETFDDIGHEIDDSNEETLFENSIEVSRMFASN